MGLTRIGGDGGWVGCVFQVLRDYARGTNKHQSTQGLQVKLKSLGFILRKKRKKRKKEKGGWARRRKRRKSH